jgi:DNA-binding CsgD family transcriptional regulator
MDSKNAGESALFRKTGLMFSGLCTFAFISYFVMSRLVDDPALKPDISDTMLFVVALFAVLFFTATLFPRFYAAQPILLLLMTPLPMLKHASSMFSLGAFVAAIILFFRIGFFEHKRIPKLVISISYFYLCEILIGLYFKLSVLDIMVPVLFMTIFLMFLLLVYRDKWIIYMKEPKPTLSLASIQVTKTEAKYLRSALADKSFKEIAIEAGVKESTIRNTMARVYKKMGVWDRSSLMSKCKNLDIIE